MKKKPIFSGVATALITPFKSGRIDFSALKDIIEFQIDSGIDALVVGGTTGEAATLSDYERDKLYSFAAEVINRRVPLIFGTGSNDTKKAIKYTIRAEKIGADAVLSVTPYYNKGTESGLISHYQQISNSTNLPSRTGVNLSINTIRTLSEEENICAIKEASDSSDRLIELTTLSDRLTLYAGNDTQIYTSLSLGGMGVISVLSNAYPCEVLSITNAFWRGDDALSLSLQKKSLKRIRALFSETNPTPIKYVMHRLGYCKSDVRLPLQLPTERTKEILDEAFKL